MSKQINNAVDARQAVAQKLASEEAFVESGLRYYYDNYGRAMSADRAHVRGPEGDVLYGAHWWMRRESLRMQLGHYSATTAIEQINAGFGYQYFLHVSRDDDNMVAYTPSFEAGEADKQIKTTLGKFLRKHFLVLTDTHIQHIESSHRAELHGEVLFATTRAEIMHVYTNMKGDSGCMRYSPSHFKFPADLHPSAVYEAPGMAVAYTQDDNGDIKSRCVVWTNPDDAEDKRYVRVYGDGKLLKRKLEEAGFTMAPLTGAKLARIPYPSSGYDNHYVMPYLDGPGGAQSDYRGRYVRLARDERYIEIIGTDMTEKLEQLDENDLFALASNHESARVRLQPVPDSTATCYISGKTFDALDERIYKIASKDGIERTVLASEIDGRGNNLATVYCVDADGSRTRSLMSLSPTDLDIAVRGVDTFIYLSIEYVKSDAAYAYCGMRKLSAKYYSTSEYCRDWCAVIDPETLTPALDTCVLPGDTVHVVVDGVLYFAHVNDMPALRSKGYVFGSPAAKNKKLMLKAAAEDTKKSRGGTYFHPNHCNNRFCELPDGTWELTSHCVVDFVFDVRVCVLKSEATAGGRFTADQLSKAFVESADAERIKALHTEGMAQTGSCTSHTTEIQRIVKRAMYDACDFCPSVNPSGTLTYASTSVSWDVMLLAIEKIRAAGTSNTTLTYLLPVFDAIMSYTKPLMDALAAHTAALDAALLAKLEAERIRQEAENAQAEAVRSTLQSEIDSLLDTLDNV